MQGQLLSYLMYVKYPAAQSQDIEELSTAQGKPLGYLKFMITQQRIPISAVSLQINGKWRQLKRSGDNYWQPAFLYTAQARSSVVEGRPRKIVNSKGPW